ncbi:hypothetical protein [Glycomyces algeriensis]|uniref:Uncharacterized protein n=1 Tax=Glycomyces algeriensis TaxID=256037 RepID=A0A9W6G7Z0_9ACTN|nr:hypothetical protein [Glycomyces algeriensis]MDA1367914.1 hypothetical protein [Glycomyces algeriensis]MDR7349453.1 hypothetical protein [Glycomyces algeriensis]GLI42156.1 hypothetical protein GALLR39Z86_20060 [Glycomyces algeriensis]
MGLISVPVDPVPSRTKIDLQLHRPYRTWLGFGRLRCDWCGDRWGDHGCTVRESAARLFLYTATASQRAAALDSGEITTTDLKLHRHARPHSRTPARHRRRKPRPYPTPPNPLAALRLELEAATR